MMIEGYEASMIARLERSVERLTAGMALSRKECVELKESMWHAREFIGMVPFHLPENHDKHIDHYLRQAELWLKAAVEPKPDTPQPKDGEDV
jgi:hypothetical protein